MYVHCIYMYMQCIYAVHMLYICCTYIPYCLGIYHYNICHCVLTCTSLYSAVPALNNAMVQKSVILYRQGSYRDVPPRNGHFMLSSVSDCRILIDILLLGYFCQSINQLDVHEQTGNSIQLNHFNN